MISRDNVLFILLVAVAVALTFAISLYIMKHKKEGDEKKDEKVSIGAKTISEKKTNSSYFKGTYDFIHRTYSRKKNNNFSKVRNPFLWKEKTEKSRPSEICKRLKKTKIRILQLGERSNVVMLADTLLSEGDMYLKHKVLSIDENGVVLNGECGKIRISLLR